MFVVLAFAGSFRSNLKQASSTGNSNFDSLIPLPMLIDQGLLGKHELVGIRKTFNIMTLIAKALQLKVSQPVNRSK